MQVLKALKFKKLHRPIEMHFIFFYYMIMKKMDGFFSAGIMEYWNTVRGVKGIIMNFIFERNELNSQTLTTTSLKI
jgi:hypothetical protein